MNPRSLRAGLLLSRKKLRKVQRISLSPPVSRTGSLYSRSSNWSRLSAMRKRPRKRRNRSPPRSRLNSPRNLRRLRRWRRKCRSNPSSHLELHGILVSTLCEERHLLPIPPPSRRQKKLRAIRMMPTILLPLTPRMREKRLLARMTTKSVPINLQPMQLSNKAKRPTKKMRTRRWIPRPGAGWSSVTAWRR